MIKNDIHIIRIPTSDLSASRILFSELDLKPFYSNESILCDWYCIHRYIFCIIQNEDQHPSLVIYVNDMQSALDRLDKFGIICDFTINEAGEFFEASFFDPAGIELRLAELTDAPQIPDFDNSQIEFTIPSSADFKDSVNFWHLLEFEVNASEAKKHPWVTYSKSRFKLGIHQHYNWTLPGLYVSAKSKQMAFFKKLESLNLDQLRVKFYLSDTF